MTVANGQLLTTPAVLDRMAQTFADHDAVVTDERTFTFAELREEVRGTAAAITGLGISPGDRVAIWCPNTWHWVVACLAIHYAGAVLVPLNTRYTAGEASDILARTKAPLLIAMGRFLGADRIADIDRDALPALRHIVRVPVETELDAVGGTWDEFMAGPRHHCRRWMPVPPPYAPTTSPTSCSPPGPPAEARVSCVRTGNRSRLRLRGRPAAR